MQPSPQTRFSLIRKSICGSFCVLLIVSSVLPAMAKSKVKKTHAITKLKFDSSAEKIELFKGIETEQLTTKVIAKNEQHGKILIQNKTDKPLTIVLPKSFVAVPINAQIPPGLFPGGGNNGPGFGTGISSGGGNNQSQSVGGNFNNNSNNNNNGIGNVGNNGNGNGNAPGFFSIPPQKTVSLPFKTVCLEHGKKTPTIRTKLKLIPTEQFTKNADLQELLTYVGSKQLNQKAMQAAIWHLTDKMSWKQLANKKALNVLVGLHLKPYFTQIRNEQMRRRLCKYR